MAAALLARAGGGQIEVASAGTEPAEAIHPNVHAAMNEMGIDLANEVPKPLEADAVRAADVVITMGCGDACPVFPGKRYEDWSLDDPAGKSIDDVRGIRDDIQDRVRKLAHDLLET